MALADQIEIKFCRVCLAVDVKMYNMKEFRLSEMFQNVTGIPACDETERVLHRVCWECAARLTAASAFRDKALLTDILLKDLVHRNQRDIEQLRQYYSHLKSPLTVQTVFTSADIECGDTPIELHRDETKRKVYKRRSKRESNEEEEEETTVFDEEEPLVEFPVKTEIESDPIAENNINIQIKDENSVTSSEVTHLDDSFTSFKDENDDEVRNTEEHINENSDDVEIIDTPIKYGIDLVEDNAEKQPTIDAIDNVSDEREDTEMTIEPNNDSDIVLEEGNVEENPMLDGIGNVSDVSSSEEDGQSLAELVSVKKTKKQTSRKVGASTKRSNRLNDGEKQKIIALKEKGVSFREIAKLTGKSITCITAWWQRYSQEDSDIAEDTDKQNDTVQPSILIANCPPHVIRNLLEAGFGHLLGKNPGDKNSEQKASKHFAKWDNLKHLIIALKQARLNTSETAELLGINRNTVHRWWTQWCTEGNLSERKRTGKKRKTTAQEDQLILDRVSQSQSIHTPSLAKEFGLSSRLVIRRLKEAGFSRQFRGPYIPLKEGRTKKVDEDLKQRILTMRQNGVPVTEIAMKFRVPRTTIYKWWRQWCKENNMETRDNNTNDSIEEQALPADAKNETIEKPPKKLSTKRQKQKPRTLSTVKAR